MTILKESRMSVRVAVYLILLAMSGPAGPTEAAKPGPDDERSLKHLKQVLWPRAYREQDPILLGRILADEFRSIDAEGNWSTKAEELEYVRTHRSSYDSMVFDITRLDVLENGSAIVAGTGTVRGADDKGQYVMRYQSTNVFIKRDRQWRAIASHVSGVKRTPA